MVSLVCVEKILSLPEFRLQSRGVETGGPGAVPPVFHKVACFTMLSWLIPGPSEQAPPL